MKHDYMIVGAGLAGIVIAERLASKGKSILLLEKRNHIGGNCYDEEMNGITVHKYGPHIFHTDNEKVWEYLNRFTEFNDYKHIVKSKIKKEYYDFPININTLHQIGIFDSVDLFKMFYENYSKKQWGKYYSELDKSVFNRVPIRNGYEENYFLDKYQGIPIDGYTGMFENMLFNKNIEIRLNNKITDVLEYEGKIIYTGMIDELFNYKYGKLPYRSLNIIFEKHNMEHYQKYPVINYPNKKRLTRKTEYKYMTGQICPKTVISKEYPCEYDGSNIPYYPIPTDKTNKLYNIYKQEADKIPNLHLIGRLAEYKYYDMDDVIEKALNLAEEL